ncbi:MAG: hypothetical protein BLITH_1020 [Brockia lithotrophica]|uniref:Uncharacterized protein n=1 Tax=Brockia lithotrophica TaxID=933949 RepID=A0A2T5G784_9BACL|nr:MAG: hypothetical protein BLITH_1020 [Brockia lithotrophica]
MQARSGFPKHGQVCTQRSSTHQKRRVPNQMSARTTRRTVPRCLERAWRRLLDSNRQKSGRVGRSKESPKNLSTQTERTWEQRSWRASSSSTQK